MTRYTVDLEALLDFTKRLADFNTNAEAIATAVDGQITELHHTWLGQGANGHSEYHQRWMELAQQMRDSLAELRESASIAHRNYTGAAETNVAMWP